MKRSGISIQAAFVLSVLFLSISLAAQQTKPATPARPPTTTAAPKVVKQPPVSTTTAVAPAGQQWTPLFLADPVSISVAPMMLAMQQGPVPVPQVVPIPGYSATASQAHPATMPPVPNAAAYAANQTAAAQPKPGDANEAMVMAILADANGVLARLAEQPDVNEAVKKADDKARPEDHAWEQRTTDNRRTLATTSNTQFADELAVIRKFADEESAKKMVKEIDDLKAKRQKRLTSIAEELRTQRETTTQARGSTRGRGRGTNTTTGANRGRGATEQTAQPEPPARGGRRGNDPNTGDPELDRLIQAWSSASYEDKRDLLKVVHEENLQELELLDESARTENAPKAVIAIEALMVLRQQRVARIGEEMKKDDARLQRQPERTTTTGSRSGRGGRGTTGTTQQGNTRGGR